MTTATCAICQDPLPSNVFSRWMGACTLPCQHELHWDCAQQQVDYISASEPTQTTLSCGLCRAVSPLPMQPSARKIAKWVMIAQLILWWSPACAIGAVAWKEPLSSRRLALTLLFATSHIICMVKRGNILATLVRSLTRLYNWKHGTEASPAITLAYLGRAMDRPREEQGRYAISAATDLCLSLVQNSIRQLFDDEEKELLKPLNETVLSLRQQFPFECFLDRKTIAYENSAVTYLQTHAPDLVLRASQVGIHIMESQDHETLLVELDFHFSRWLPSYLSDSPVDSPFTNPLFALRIALIGAIAENQGRQNEQVTALFATFIQEARTPNNTLLSLLKAKLKHHDFTQIPKTRLLIDGRLLKDLFKALVKLKHNDLSAQGFVMPPPRPDSISSSSSSGEV